MVVKIEEVTRYHVFHEDGDFIGEFEDYDEALQSARESAELNDEPFRTPCKYSLEKHCIKSKCGICD